jgi:cell division protein FtsW (lipid II flippase)
LQIRWSFALFLVVISSILVFQSTERSDRSKTVIGALLCVIIIALVFLVIFREYRSSKKEHFSIHFGKEIMEHSALLNERHMLYREVIDILSKRGRIEISKEDYARLKPFLNPETARNQGLKMMSSVKALGALVNEAN